MAYQLTPLGRVVLGTLKWVAVPVFAALIGLTVIGPMMAGSTAAPKKHEHKIVAPPTSATGKKFQEIRSGGSEH